MKITIRKLQQTKNSNHCSLPNTTIDVAETVSDIITKLHESNNYPHNLDTTFTVNSSEIT